MLYGINLEGYQSIVIEQFQQTIAQTIFPDCGRCKSNIIYGYVFTSVVYHYG